MTGKLEKITLLSYTDNSYNTADGKSYVALINPEQISQEFKTDFQKIKPKGGKESKKFETIQSPKLSLKFVFDGTGVLDISNAAVAENAKEQYPSGNPEKKGEFEQSKSTGGTVEEQINAFKEVALVTKGEIHEPGYIKLFWGEIMFKGRLLSLKIDYTLFKRDGTPLRAIGNAVFEKDLDSATERKKENKKSPDLTRIRVVQEGDTLPLMCFEVYKNSTLYLEVAKVNGLVNYRTLAVGSKVFFPPLTEKVS